MTPLSGVVDQDSFTDGSHVGTGCPRTVNQWHVDSIKSEIYSRDEFEIHAVCC